MGFVDRDGHAPTANGNGAVPLRLLGTTADLRRLVLDLERATAS